MDFKMFGNSFHTNTIRESINNRLFASRLKIILSCIMMHWVMIVASLIIPKINYVCTQSVYWMCIDQKFFVSDFTELFNQLKCLRGGLAVKKVVLQEVIDESLRFKRKALSNLLQDFSAAMEKNGNSVSPSPGGFPSIKNDFINDFPSEPTYGPPSNHHS